VTVTATPARPVDTVRPSAGRRTAVAVAGALACLLPTVWSVAITVQLLTGIEADHRFHQVTGQGLLLCALWLAGLVPMVRAGWRGVAPSAVTVVQAALFAGSGLAMGLLAPGAGALPVAVGRSRPPPCCGRRCRPGRRCAGCSATSTRCSRRSCCSPLPS
jgi:hypothetical protein